MTGLCANPSTIRWHNKKKEPCGVDSRPPCYCYPWFYSLYHLTKWVHLSEHQGSSPVRWSFYILWSFYLMSASEKNKKRNTLLNQRAGRNNSCLNEQWVTTGLAFTHSWMKTKCPLISVCRCVLLAFKPEIRLVLVKNCNAKLLIFFWIKAHTHLEYFSLPCIIGKAIIIYVCINLVYLETKEIYYFFLYIYIRNSL